MGATLEAVEALSERLDECRPRWEEIWGAFARDWGKKADAISYLVELAFSLSPEQVTQTENGGIPAASLNPEQVELLARAEALMRELKFFGRDSTLAESRLQFDGRGHLQFTPGGSRGVWLGINWLPHSQVDPQRSQRFGAVQQAWWDRREWLVRQHYADFRQAADCGRLLFQLALTLSPEQIAQMEEGRSLPVTALRAEQRALLEAAASLYPREMPRDLRGYAVKFELWGQFWLRREGRNENSGQGIGWLPSSWWMR